MVVTRRAVLKALVATGVGAVTGAGSYGFLYGRHRLSITRTSLTIAGLPSALKGLRIGLLTDLHRGRWVSAEDVGHAVAALMTERPDLIVLGGDYVTWGDRRFVGPAAEALAPLDARCGVFAILGNHDDDHDMPAALGRNGVQMLKDARTRLQIRNETVDLIGVRFWTKRGADIATLMRGAVPTTILLAHDPRRPDDLTPYRPALVLSGHTHGGQVVLPVIGPVAAQKFPVVAGTGRRNRTTIFVSRGVGTVYVPIRLNCPPDVAILTLRPA